MDVRKPRSFVRRFAITVGVSLAGASLWAVARRLAGARQDVAGAALWPRPDGSLPSPAPTNNDRIRSYGVVWDHAA